ncbi:unnamed protein product [Adineta steineri]|uniref:G-protein coupled receptors family 1 profile domain-containing protein n=1 Tax=Adineta steineri TaxID=433720 RepID=A0A814PD56_9BILA|nr:unnamed protein product [Adineta steineri]CAF4007783.1 unnamed protein product [Adineta steineri]
MSDDIIARLPSITIDVNRIILSIQLIVGTFGNLMNILIFTRRTLRNNPCSLYFLASSIGNIFFLYSSLLSRLLSSGWQIDFSNTSVLLCKLRIYFVYIFLSLDQWSIVLASFDRYLISSRNIRLRQLSNVSIARKIILITISLIFLIHFHTLIWYTSYYKGTVLTCASLGQIYPIIFSIFFLIFTCLLPPIFMGIFGLLTILNIRKVRIQVVPQNNNVRNERLRTQDRELMKMLLIQVIVSIICTAPFAFDTLFNAIVANFTRSSSFIVINTFADTLARVFIYFNPVVGFFIYTLAGPIFRIETKRIFLRVIKFILTPTALERYMPRIPQQRDQTATNQYRMSMAVGRNPNTLFIKKRQTEGMAQA